MHPADLRHERQRRQAAARRRLGHDLYQARQAATGHAIEIIYIEAVFDDYNDRRITLEEAHAQVKHLRDQQRVRLTKKAA